MARPPREQDISTITDFERALELRDAGNLTEAVQILRRLAAKWLDQASILGTLAGLEYQAGDYESAVTTGRSVVLLSPRSGQAKVTTSALCVNVDYGKRPQVPIVL
jgi:hypothetical protein